MANLTQIQIDNIKELYNQNNYSLKELSKIVNVPRTTLKDLIKRDFKVKSSPRSLTDEEKSEILNLWYNGNDPSQISKLLSNKPRNISCIRNFLKSLNVYHDKKIVQNNPFKDNNLSWYWIGYLITDGNLKTINSKSRSYNINISQSGSNLGHLINYANFLGNNVKVKFLNNKEIVEFSNKEIYNYLLSIGLTPRKSSLVKLLVPLNRDILRGIFDGDGSISKNYIIKITSGSINLLNQIQDFLKINNVNFKLRPDKSKQKMNHNPCYDLIIPLKHGNAKKFYDLIYYDNCMCLQRKKLKFEEYFLKISRNKIPE